MKILVALFVVCVSGCGQTPTDDTQSPSCHDVVVIFDSGSLTCPRPDHVVAVDRVGDSVVLLCRCPRPVFAEVTVR